MIVSHFGGIVNTLRNEYNERFRPIFRLALQKWRGGGMKTDDMGRKRLPTSKSPEGEMLLKIKLARVAQNMAQADVAEALNIAPRTWGNYESGTSTLPVDVLLKLPAVLRVSIADLLPSSIVTAVDQRRSKDPRLEEIILAWTDMSDDMRRQLFELARMLVDLERARQNVQARARKPAGQ
jgi:transcriptional regulator with XRE-family HTH domain